MKRLPVIALVLLLPAQAHAVSAGDVLDRMNHDQRSGYISGALEMLAYELSRSGEGEKAECVIRWYFEGDGPHEAVAVFDNHKDLPAVGILRVLVDRHCP